MADARVRGWALAGFGMLMVSTDSFFIRKADFDSWTIAFLFGVASTIALSIVAAFGSTRPIGDTVRGAPLPLAGIVLLSAATQIAFTGAVNHTAVSNVVVIVGATPIFASVLGWLLLRERTEPRVIVAIVLVVVGIGVVVSGSLGTPTLDGDLLALAAIVMFSFSVILWRRHPEIDRPVALALSSATMALVTAPLASVGDAPLRVFVAVGLMGLAFNPIGRISYTSAPKYAPASEVALFTPVETVAATAWAWIFFSEQPSTQTVVGGIIVIGAVLFGTFGQRASGASGRRDERNALAEQ